MADTIFAEATAPGRAGLSVVRISGPLSGHAARMLAGPLPGPRTAALREIRSLSGELLDEALVVFFEAGRSFTGEEVVELQLHGSVAVVRAVLTELGATDGLRMAEPGEFTRRALDSGRLDLTQVEGLADLIAAETDLQRQQAMRVFGGSLTSLAETWRQKLTRAMALLEVTIDFAEEDVPADVSAEVRALLTDVKGQIERELQTSQFSERVRHGFEVAIVGPPNAGKSSLLNYLAGRDAAITSPVPGTTRDMIEVRMDLGGIPVTLVDTAGLRETDDSVEAEGVLRARERASSADIRIVLGSHSESDDVNTITVTTKADLGEKGPGLAVSSVTGQGAVELTQEIAQRLRGKANVSGSAIRQRHVAALNTASDLLEAALNGECAAEFLVEDIRLAVRQLEGLVGRVDVENLLDVVFLDFCIGK
ncbi:tRNA uridine-5-carboxymethylaminomethyl(34) synthesis GTPase MnmE [Halovulum sp. GXIMD14793]